MGIKYHFGARLGMGKRKIRHSSFYAKRFPTRGRLQFQLHVLLCMENHIKCLKVKMDLEKNVSHFGGRKKYVRKNV